jgi:hypothetical protein
VGLPFQTWGCANSSQKEKYGCQLHWDLSQMMQQSCKSFFTGWRTCRNKEFAEMCNRHRPKNKTSSKPTKQSEI